MSCPAGKSAAKAKELRGELRNDGEEIPDDAGGAFEEGGLRVAVHCEDRPRNSMEKIGYGVRASARVGDHD